MNEKHERYSRYKSCNGWDHLEKKYAGEEDKALLGLGNGVAFEVGR